MCDFGFARNTFQVGSIISVDQTAATQLLVSPHLQLYCLMFAHSAQRSMASIFDSEAQSETRLKELNFGDRVISAIQANGVKTRPTAIRQSQRMCRCFFRLPLAGLQTQESSSTKRLIFEARTFVVVVLRQGVEQPDDLQPPKITHAERTTRITAVKQSLSGVALVGELEPAHVLLKKAAAIYHQNCVKYLEHSHSIRRAHEVEGAKQNIEFQGHPAGVPACYARASSAVRQGRGQGWKPLPPTSGDKQMPLGEALLNLRMDPRISLHLAPLSVQLTIQGDHRLTLKAKQKTEERTRA